MSVQPTLQPDNSRAARRLRAMLTGAVALGGLMLLVAVLAVFVLVGANRDTTGWVNHTYQVERHLSGVRVGFEEAEAARRGYLVTGDPAYVHIYDGAAAALSGQLDAVRRLTADNPRQQSSIARLRALVLTKLAEQEASMRADAADRADPAALIRGGQQVVDGVRATLATMVGEENRLLELRTARQSDESTVLFAVVAASGVVLVLLAGACYLLVRRYAADLDRSAEALRSLNAGLEDEVARRTAELTRANTEIQRFAYIVSHDLRSPLVNVMGFTSEMQLALKPLRALLDRAGDDPALQDARELREARAAVEHDIPESLGFIRASTQKMDRLINAILKLSREGRRNLSPEAVSMAALMGQVADTLKSQTDDRGAAIEIDPALPDVVTDRTAVEQVFGNILENALKYLKPGRPGAIVVRGRREGTAVVYEIEDNGRGIAPHDHERVFDLFRRAGVQDQPGEGIGLAHVRALVHRLGGNISVQSELDRGATFRISLPAVLIRPEDTVA